MAAVVERVVVWSVTGGFTNSGTEDVNAGYW